MKRRIAVTVVMAVVLTSAAALVFSHLDLSRFPVAYPLIVSSTEETDGLRHTGNDLSVASNRINVNTANTEILCTLNGMRSDTALNLVADRETNGFYYFPEDLLSVKGIGEKTLNKLLPQICFDIPLEDSDSEE